MLLRIHPDFIVEDNTIEGAIEGATPNLKKRLAKLLESILRNEKKRVPDYAEMTAVSPKTIERYIKILREHNLIDFKGEAPQVSGYIIHPSLKEKLKP